MLFSIIMPAYNAERFLAKSIQSVLRQTYSDWELILINDGSNDNTDQVAMAFADREKRIRYYCQENAGVSATRNRGIELVLGEYVLFMDADDEIDKQMLELLHNASKRNACDIMVFNAYRTNENSAVINKVTEPVSDDVVILGDEQAKKCIYSLLASERTFGLPWLFAVKRQVIANIRFRTDMIMYEDLLFDIQMCQRAESILCLPNYFYYYRDNPSGCVRTFNYQKLKDLKLAYEAKMELAKEKSLSQNEKKINKWFVLTILSNYMSILEDAELSKEYIETIRKDAFIVDRFAQLRDLPSGVLPSKLVMGNVLERTALREYYLLRRKVKALLCR